jgi:protein-tyrosine phosphatase
VSSRDPLDDQAGARAVSIRPARPAEATARGRELTYSCLVSGFLPTFTGVRPTPEGDRAGTQQFTILFVCTANICRSPMAAAIAQDLLNGLAPAGIAIAGSAGVRAAEGAVTERLALDVLASRGVTAAPRPARQLTPPMLDASDLVLTADRSHRASVLGLRPGALRRTFTLLEFARIARATSDGLEPAAPERARTMVDATAGHRPLVPPTAPGDDDIADPYGRSPREFERCGEITAEALVELVPRLFPRSS